jgi:glutamyl-tRNA reductase
MIDIALPRDIDPGVRDIHGMFLHDINDLEQVIKRTSGVHASAAEQANHIVVTEAKFFVHEMTGDLAVPTVVALHERLDELCRQELEAFRHYAGPFTDEQEHALQGLARRVASLIAGSLAKELKELPEEMEQDQLTSVIKKLFHLPQPPSLVAGANLVHDPGSPFATDGTHGL